MKTTISFGLVIVIFFTVNRFSTFNKKIFTTSQSIEKEATEKSDYIAFSPEEKWKMLEAVSKLRTDYGERVDAPWKFVGPDKIQYQDNSTGLNTYYNGRIRSLQYSNNAPGVGLTIGSGTGGVWEVSSTNGTIQGSTPKSIQGNLPTPNIGYVARHPFNSNILICGTGEPVTNHSGMGIFRSLNGGNTWVASRIIGGIIPTSVNKVIFDRTNPAIVHASTNEGYLKSIDTGASWRYYLQGYTSDLVIHPTNTDTLITCIPLLGFYRSVNKGLTWSNMNSFVGVDSIGYTSIAWSNSSPNILFTNITSAKNGLALGVYKSINRGNSWVKCNIDNPEFHWNADGYNNCIEIAPTAANIVFAGGGALIRTTDGFNFTTVLITTGYHADIHAIVYNPNGSELFIGTDGGIFSTNDLGNSWSAKYNVVPTTQFYDMDMANNNHNIIMGGLQDNAIVSKTPLGWQWGPLGDGWTAAINQEYSNEAISSANTSLHTTIDMGSNWNWNGNLPNDMNGINKFVVWERSIDNGGLFYANVPISHSATQIYYRNVFNSWIPFNQSFSPNIYHLSVSTRPNKGSNNNIYICLAGLSDTSKIWKRDRLSGSFVNITKPSLVYANNVIYKTFTHPTRMDEVYAISAGTTTIHKVWKSTDAGSFWLNITGNLPNIPLNCFWVHPVITEIMMVGSQDFGVFRTDDNGINWYRWETGMPKGTSVTAIKFMDSISTNGSSAILVSTYGRGLWKRSLNGTDPFVVSQKNILPAMAFDFTVTILEGETIKLNLMNIHGGMYDFKLLNSNGILLKEIHQYYNPLEVIHHINLSNLNLAKGVYFVSITDFNGNKKTKKILFN